MTVKVDADKFGAEASVKEGSVKEEEEIYQLIAAAIEGLNPEISQLIAAIESLNQEISQLISEPTS